MFAERRKHWGNNQTGAHNKGFVFRVKKDSFFNMELSGSCNQIEVSFDYDYRNT